MDNITLHAIADDGKTLQATFSPERGMNLLSYKKGGLEVIDQTTKSLFEERGAGLGALIGPHFHHRKVIPPVKQEELFPHIERVKKKGIQEPFSHGIARYAPWQAKATEQKLTALINGKDTWMGVSLAELEGQNFKMQLDAELSAKGLRIALSVVSDTDSLVGLHYYYHLPKQGAKVIASVQSRYLENGQSHQIPEEWHYDQFGVMHFPLDRAADYTFHPFPHPLEGKIVLDAIDYRLAIRYHSPSQENSWQLYHPYEASFVCIEPISAQDPRHPNLTVSSVTVDLEILEGLHES